MPAAEQPKPAAVGIEQSAIAVPYAERRIVPSWSSARGRTSSQVRPCGRASRHDPAPLREPSYFRRAAGKGG